LVGYKLSPLLWKKVRYGLSAGRVQSVAVRLVVDREEEREKFKAEEYWRIFSDLLVEKNAKECKKLIIEQQTAKQQTAKQQMANSKLEFAGIKFELVKVKGQRSKVEGKKGAEEIVNEVIDKKWIISDISKKETKRYPKPPFITSTLQRTAANIFGYSAKQTMGIAQKLYEAGLITYMRTDSFNVVSKELSKIRSLIKSKYGESYLNPKEVRYRSKSKSAQEAHEAIRPTDISKNSKALDLTRQEARLYDLIRNRVLACQMNPARAENTVLQITIDKYLFESRGQRVVFDGFLKAYPERISENILPEIKPKQELYPLKLIGQQNFTSPPPRYSEATLIKTLEKYGIGRPSTYAPIISTILARKYVEKEGKYFIPTEMGKVVTKLLKKYFDEIVDTGFTAGMEEDLDDIAKGDDNWVEVIRKFYKPFIKDVEKGEKNITSDEFKILGKSKYKCPECGKKMVKKIGRFGVFLSCADFPKCKGMRSVDGKTNKDKENEVKEELQSEEFQSKYLEAPKSGDGKIMVLKSGRYGKFWAHPDYPKVKEAKPLLLKEKCPKCGEPLVERRGKWGKTFVGCSGYPKCRYIKKAEDKRLKAKGLKTKD
jgi:DNA topoisomerase-1